MSKYDDMNATDFDRLFEKLELYYPFALKGMVRWYSIGKEEITIECDDGYRWVYYGLQNSIRCIQPSDEENELEIDETLWRREFGRKLFRRMALVPMNQEQLSEASGISQHTISKYIQGKATPSNYNTFRLARALKCAEEELTGVDYLINKGVR